MLWGRSVFKHNRGFSLVEALVTASVLAIGLLGLAALQMTSTKNIYSAEKRSDATMLANDIIDRMRANRPAAEVGSYDIAIGGAAPAGAAIANSDLREWKTRLAGSLPSGDGSISRNADIVTVAIQWDDSHGLDGETTQQFVYETRL